MTHSPFVCTFKVHMKAGEGIMATCQVTLEQLLDCGHRTEVPAYCFNGAEAAKIQNPCPMPSKEPNS